ncbi:chaperonin 10-like protein [Mrakia frigida]|uniref:chaperonin 10-like protein n=1 Tax=Mrakia frigida TaxID=29902 RepID=UPI003FCC15CB
MTSSSSLSSPSWSSRLSLFLFPSSATSEEDAFSASSSTRLPPLESKRLLQGLIFNFGFSLIASIFFFGLAFAPSNSKIPAAFIFAYGGASIWFGNEGSFIQDVVKIREENMPEVRDYETLVEVRYIAVGPADVTCLRIQNRDITPGFDLSGIVVKDKSGRFKEGDRVFGMVYGGLEGTIKDDKLRKQYQDNGSFATYAVVHSDMLARCPDKEKCFAECAALPFCTLTAYQAFDFVF